ncbi:MAG: hypothetical protein SGJ21_16060 [Alphaproteobacteria bacterium]|nr:hypothetical protein [Alphaproteobacteria bacterium]
MLSNAHGENSLKAAAPAGAAALAIAAAIVAGSLLTSEKKAPPLEAGTSSPTVSSPTSSTPSSSGSLSSGPGTPAPGGMPGVAFDQGAPAGASVGPSAASSGMEIVVKFKDDAKVIEIIDAFWKNPSAGRAQFDAFKARRPEFASVTLDRVTYSNELVLVHEGGPAASSRLAAMREVAGKLKSVADISYAEPNMTAHPGGQ